MILSAHQPQYIPWLGYFDKIDKSDAFVFLDNVQYKPREYQNRNKIRTKDGWMMLTVPVISKGLGYQKICDVKIDNSFPWQRKHWNSLKVCCNKSPFFKEHYCFFEKVYSSDWDKFIDLAVHIIKYILSQLGINTKLYFESELEISSTKTDRIIELCKELNADTYLSGVGGKNYLEEEKFIQAGINLKYQNFGHPVYHQLYTENSNHFIPNMSILDLLFNEGKKSIEILRGVISQ